jgi:hypothetical protein
LTVGVASAAEDGISDQDVGDALTDLVDHAGRVDTEPCWQLARHHILHLSRTDFPIESIDTGGVHRYAQLSRAGVRFIGIDHLHDFASASGSYPKDPLSTLEVAGPTVQRPGRWAARQCAPAG